MGTFYFNENKFCYGEWKDNELNGLAVFYKDDKVHKGKSSNNYMPLSNTIISYNLLLFNYD